MNEGSTGYSEHKDQTDPSQLMSAVQLEKES